ncbi:MAG: TrpR-related protein YerC/YecD [Clostridia bacterium]|nr:TrpR-related protein YerC/YecD [Clostridia bacterium]
MEKRKTEELIPELYETIVRLETTEDCAAFFSDLCTFKELEQMAQRLAAAKLLLDGKTYVQVIDEVDISSATLSRVSRCIRYSDGYARMLKE